MVKSLGADKVIDYKQDDFTQSGDSYDLIFDAVGKIPSSKRKTSLKKGGTYIDVLSRSHSFKLVPKDLVFLKEIIEEGHLKSVIDKTFPFDKIVEAHRYVDGGHKKGNVVIRI